MRWCYVAAFSDVPSERLGHLIELIKDNDVLYIYTLNHPTLQLVQAVGEHLRGKICVVFFEVVNIHALSDKLSLLRRLLEVISTHADAVFLHLPRHRILWSEDLAKFPIIRTGLVVPLVTRVPLARRRQLRFIHYKSIDKFYKGSDIVERLLHLPHIIVGYIEGAVQVSYSAVLRLQASSELLVHPTRCDSYSRFLLSGMLLLCVPILLVTDAELPFVYANTKEPDKLAAYRELLPYFSVHLDADSYVEAVCEFFRERELIMEYREKLMAYLIHHSDLWSPEIIYQRFRSFGLHLPADLVPVTHLCHWPAEERTLVVPNGPWSSNPLTSVFWVP